MNEASVWIAHRSEATTVPDDQIECIVGDGLKIDPQRIQDFAANPLSAVEQDLVLLVGAIAFADRRVRRRRGSGWRRDIQLSIPVSDPDMWSDNQTSTHLRDAITFVTGDNWEFQFRYGFEPLVTRQSSIDFSQVSDVVIPFSNGLDSYSQWLLQSAKFHTMGPLRIHSRSRTTDRSRSWKLEHSPLGSGTRLDIPISLQVGKHPEPSYRSRSFLFHALAALAAAKLGVTRVLIGENGISSIGPILLPYGDEYPYVGTHPSFTARLSSFVNFLLGSRISFEHPVLFRTKGQVLRNALHHRDDRWRDTISCVRGYRDKLGASHCGICSGCLMRRLALHSMGLQDMQYSWDNLSRSMLGECRSGCLERDTNQNDEDIASHAIHVMEAAAQLGWLDPDNPKFRRCGWELALYNQQDLHSLAKSVSDLFKIQASEWMKFKDGFSQQSLLRRYEIN